MKPIKTNELRVGNWVYNSYTRENMEVYPMMIPQLHRIEKENGSLKDCNIEPIPLTEEILLELGFILLDKNYDSQDFNVYKLGDFTYNTSHNKFWFNNFYDFKQPTHLHQLQNLFFALTGEELVKIK